MVNEPQDTKSAVPSGVPGEFTEEDLVAAIRRILSGEPPEVLLGPGDDAALVELGIHVGILTADMLVEGVHFERDSIAPRDLGYKAVAVNVSDIAAMGGSPRYGLVSLGLPLDLGTHWVVELYGGLREAAAEYAMTLVGGDTSRAGQIVVSIALTGEVARSRAVTRSGARPGDRIVVTGALGAAAGGLRLAQAPSHDVSRILASPWGRELLATLPSEAVGPAAQKLEARFGTALTEIGEIRPGEGLVAIEADGSERTLMPRGWDHFAS